MDVSGRLEKDSGVWTKHITLRYGKRFAGTPREVQYKTAAGPFAESADDLVALSLLPAMVKGEPLIVRGAVSERLLRNLPRLQELLCLFAPEFGHRLSPVQVEATSVVSHPPVEGAKTVAFFSGGLDSFWTALQHRDELDALIFVHGFDIDVRNMELREIVSRRIQRVAAELELPLIEIETNVRSFVNRFVHWALYCGSALSCLGLALQPGVRKVYIPGSDGLDWLEPWGSHPMLDPLWSTEALEVVYDGVEFNRVQKAASIAGSQVAQRNLRVCYSNTHGEYNCGECRKCVLMQLALATLGVLDRFPVFETPLSLEAVRSFDLSDGHYRDRFVNYVDIVRNRGGDAKLVDAMLEALSGWARGLSEPKPREVSDGNVFGRLFPPVAIAAKDTPR